MVREVTLEAAAGAVDPVTLNATTDAGMVIRGRTTSSLLAQVAGELFAAMTGSETSATALGATGPRQWSLNSWVSDAVPPLACGPTAAVAHESLIGV